jgi:hypothetical protein
MPTAKAADQATECREVVNAVAPAASADREVSCQASQSLDDVAYAAFRDGPATVLAVGRADTRFVVLQPFDRPRRPFGRQGSVVLAGISCADGTR